MTGAVEQYNNLVNDWTGTLSIKISANLTTLIGVYGDIGVTFDWKGNVAIQKSYAVPGVADTMSGGLFDIGAAIGLAFTNAEDVNGLLGKGSAIGASGGYLGYVTIDALSFDEMESINGNLDGFQFGVGVGGGMDIHLTETYTEEVISWNTFDSIGSMLDFIFGKNQVEKCIE